MVIMEIIPKLMRIIEKNPMAGTVDFNEEILFASSDKILSLFFN